LRAAPMQARIIPKQHAGKGHAANDAPLPHEVRSFCEVEFMVIPGAQPLAGHGHELVARCGVWVELEKMLADAAYPLKVTETGEGERQVGVGAGFRGGEPDR